MLKRWYRDTSPTLLKSLWDVVSEDYECGPGSLGRAFANRVLVWRGRAAGVPLLRATKPAALGTRWHEAEGAVKKSKTTVLFAQDVQVF